MLFPLCRCVESWGFDWSDHIKGKLPWKPGFLFILSYFHVFHGVEDVQFFHCVSIRLDGKYVLH